MAAITLSAYDSPGSLTPSGAPANPRELNRREKRTALANPGAGYFPTSNALWGAGLAAVDGNPVFTYLDVPRMMRDPKLRFVASLFKAPFQKCKFVVKAEGTGSDAGDAKVAQFVQTTIERFKRKSLPKLLSRYFRYGWFVGAAEFEAANGYLRLSRVRCVEPRDAQPRVWASGEKRNQFAGFVLTNGTVPEGERFVGWPHAMWFGGYEEYGPFYDAPPLMGAFQPWLRKNTRGGAIQNTELAMRKNAGHGGILRHPPGTSVYGPDESASPVNNQDIARQILDYQATFGAMVLENTVQPANPQMYEWDYTPPEITTGLEVFLDYEEQLDKQIVEGVGIPLEVAGQGSDSGSGYKGRLISYGGFLDIVTELMELILAACDPWLTPLVRMNYGEGVTYSIDVISLSEIAQEEEKRNPAVGSAIGAPSPGLPGDGSAGGGNDASPLQLSATPAPAPVPDPVLDVLKSLAASVAALAVKQLSPAPVPGAAPIELAATVGPEGADPQSKKAALDATQQKLMRSRKATIAQLLAYAMVKKQQEATAAGKPEAAAGSLAALSQMAGDPMAVAKIVGLDAKELSAAAWTELELAWVRIEDSRTGSPRAENPDLLDKNGKPRRLYGQRALDAIAREKGLPHTERARTRQMARLEAAGIAQKTASGEATADDLKNFGETLATLKPADLRQLGDYFKVNLQGVRGGKLNGKQMLAKLLAHVDAQVAKQAPKPEPAQDTPPVAKQDTAPVANEPEPAPEAESQAAPATQEPETAPVPEAAEGGDFEYPEGWEKRSDKQRPNESLPDASRPKLDYFAAQAVFQYTSTAYTPINKALRKGKPVPRYFAQEARALDEVFRSLKPFDQPVRVNRGVELPSKVEREFIESLKAAAGAGVEVAIPGYSSTSTSDLKDIGIGGGRNVQLHIDAVEGLDARPYSANPDENELLLNHNSRFVVDRVEQEGEKWHAYMRQVPTNQSAAPTAAGASGSQSSSAEKTKPEPGSTPSAAPSPASQAASPTPPSASPSPEPEPPRPPTQTATAAPAPEPEPEKSAPVPAKEPRAALDELTALAGDPEKLTAAAERAADLARRTSAQGGSLAVNDAILAATRGEYGAAARKAMDELHRDPAYLAGTLTERYTRAAAALAPVLGGKPAPVPATPPTEPATGGATPPTEAATPPAAEESEVDDEPLSPEEQAAADARLAAARERFKQRQAEFEKNRAAAEEKTEPEPKPTGKNAEPTPANISAEATDAVHDLLAGEFGNLKMVPISAIRAHLADAMPGATKEQIDDALLEMRRNKKLRLISADDGGGTSPEYLAGGVKAVGENFVYAEKTDATPPPRKQEDRPAPAPKGSGAKPEQQESTLASALRGGLGANGIAPIHQMRDAYLKAHPGATHKEFNDALLAMRRDGKVRLIAIDDRGRATPEQLKNSVFENNETMFYAEPTEKTPATPPTEAARGEVTTPTEAATSPAAEPEVQQPVAQPEPAPVPGAPKPAKAKGKPTPKPKATPAAPKTEKELEADADALLRGAGATPRDEEPKPKRGRGNKTGKSSADENDKATLEAAGIKTKQLSRERQEELASQIRRAAVAAYKLEQAVADKGNPRRIQEATEGAKAALAQVPAGYRQQAKEHLPTLVAEYRADDAGKAPVKDRADDLDPTLAGLLRGAAPEGEPEVRETPEPVDPQKARAEALVAARAELDAVKRAPGAKDTRSYREKLKAAEAKVAELEAAAKPKPAPKSAPKPKGDMVRAALDAANKGAQEDDGDTGILDDEAIRAINEGILKRRAAQQPQPAPAPAPDSPKPKAAPKGKTGPAGAPAVATLAKKPLADKKHLETLAAAAPEGPVRDALETAAHNLRGDKVEMEPAERRRQTVQRLGAAYRDSGGHPAVADAIRQFGGRVEGEVGAVVPFDGAAHGGPNEEPYDVSRGRQVRIVRPAVYGPDGSVALKAHVEPAPVPDGGSKGKKKK